MDNQLWVLQVVGSNPAAPTNKINHLVAIFQAKSSQKSGLGRLWEDDGLSQPDPGNRMSTSLRQLQPRRHLRGPGNTSAAERSYFRSGGVVVIAQIRRVLFSCEICAAVSGRTIALS